MYFSYADYGVKSGKQDDDYGQFCFRFMSLFFKKISQQYVSKLIHLLFYSTVIVILGYFAVHFEEALLEKVTVNHLKS